MSDDGDMVYFQERFFLLFVFVVYQRQTNTILRQGNRFDACNQSPNVSSSLKTVFSYIKLLHFVLYYPMKLSLTLSRIQSLFQLSP